MASQGLFSSVFDPARLDAAELALKGPASVHKGDVAIAAWQLLLGAMALRHEGLQSEANDWLNHAAGSKYKEDIFSAETLSEAGLALSKADRAADAASTLDSASAIWRDACEAGFAACAGGDEKRAIDFGLRLLPMAEAANVELPFRRINASGAVVATVTRMWLTERAIPRRAEVFYAFATLLARAGQPDDARAIGRELLAWVERHFTGLAGRDGKTPVQDRSMEASVRVAIYRIKLAQGEIELAAGNYRESANAFADAARMFEGHAFDGSDVVRLLQAKFNEANSLLRLREYDKALGIYALVEHGFEHFADPSALQRVQQAILFTKMKKEEEGVD
jgi:tetratricopeptide (TPR) repeat protein